MRVLLHREEIVVILSSIQLLAMSQVVLHLDLLRATALVATPEKGL
jgi:hypothetical protein